MYEIIKQIIKKTLPEKFVKKQTKHLRYLYGLTFRGNKYQCNICEVKLRKFIRLASNDLMCPNCGSLPRTRGLWNILKNEINNKTILHFSPSPPLKSLIEHKANPESYITTDYEDEFESDMKLNIEKIDLQSESIDIIICYHILEHVEHDFKALSELNRILKQDGTCYVQTPFKEGSIYEDPTIIDPAERLIHFGQKDHLRIYSPEGLKHRMNKSGFKTEIIEIENEENNYYGLKNTDIIIKGEKVFS